MRGEAVEVHDIGYMPGCKRGDTAREKELFAALFAHVFRGQQKIAEHAEKQPGQKRREQRRVRAGENSAHDAGRGKGGAARKFECYFRTDGYLHCTGSSKSKYTPPAGNCQESAQKFFRCLTQTRSVSTMCKHEV